ncbi:MAG: hypothetical protein LBL31_03755 [Spirochaetaceae bacterium]|jgi:hypothetical protein|nr:hypothetical protein [Spirochaetaceae bacterium]
MRITVSYHARDTYDVSDEKWREAMALCGNDEEDAFDFLISEAYLEKSDVTDRYVEAEQDKTEV